MAFKRLLSLIATQGVEPRLNALARWTEASEADVEPDYGSFVDENGRVINGTMPCRAFLESSDPTQLELAPEVARSLGDPVTLVFIDWGRQSLSWEEIFELWDAWEGQGMIAGCGAVGVPWNLTSQWICPGWVAFRGSFDGSPLSVSVRQAVREPSFFAKAKEHRESFELAETREFAAVLPMLPFTMDDLLNPSKAWPSA